MHELRGERRAARWTARSRGSRPATSRWSKASRRRRSRSSRSGARPSASRSCIPRIRTSWPSPPTAPRRCRRSRPAACPCSVSTTMTRSQRSSRQARPRLADRRLTWPTPASTVKLKAVFAAQQQSRGQRAAGRFRSPSSPVWARFAQRHEPAQVIMKIQSIALRYLDFTCTWLRKPGAGGRECGCRPVGWVLRRRVVSRQRPGRDRRQFRRERGPGAEPHPGRRCRRIRVAHARCSAAIAGRTISRSKRR